MRQCSATSKRTGRRCKRYTANDDLSVCRMHGGAAPQTKAKAAERTALRHALAELPQRSADEILLSAMHTADAYARWQTAGADDPELLIEALTLSSRLAKLTLDQEIEAKRSKIVEDVASAYLKWLEEILDGLALTEEQMIRAPGLITAGLERMIDGAGPPAIESGA